MLDLYAGSGAVGLEAWSRGAARVVLVESAASAAKVLRANLTGLRGAEPTGDPGRAQGQGTPGPAGKVEVVAARAEQAAAQFAASSFDLVFADPPYDLATVEVAGVFATLAQRQVPRAGALIVVERATRDLWVWPLGYRPSHDRRYGDATLHYATFDPSSL
jgi:16S rRNA (guanine966-N2)-methyltransferase